MIAEYFRAFLVGGLICALGQLLIDLTGLTPARILTGCVVLGVILSAVGVYEPLREWAGAGATVPLLGFGNTLANGMREAISQDGTLGIFTGGFSACAAGVSAAILFSLPISLLFRPKCKS